MTSSSRIVVSIDAIVCRVPRTVTRASDNVNVTRTEGPYTDDQVLVAALRRGDEDAFAWLDRSLRRVAAPPRAYLRRDTGGRRRRRTDTWLAVVKGIDRFEGRAAVSTWLYRILANIARTRGVREHRTIPFSSAAGALDEGAGPAVDPERFGVVGDPGYGQWAAPPTPWNDEPEASLESKETLAAVASRSGGAPARRNARSSRCAISKDGRRARCVTRLDLSETNQRVLLHRARAKVRRALEAALRGSGVVMLRIFRRRRRDLLCVEFVEVVTDYLEGALSARDRARLEAHLTACDGCTRYLAQIRTTIELTGRLTHRRRRRPRLRSPRRAPRRLPRVRARLEPGLDGAWVQPSGPPSTTRAVRKKSSAVVRWLSTPSSASYARLAPANAVSFQNGSGATLLRPVRHVQVGLGVGGVAGRRSERAPGARRLVADVDAEVEVLGPELCAGVGGAGDRRAAPRAPSTQSRTSRRATARRPDRRRARCRARPLSRAGRGRPAGPGSMPTSRAAAAIVVTGARSSRPSRTTTMSAPSDAHLLIGSEERRTEPAHRCTAGRSCRWRVVVPEPPPTRRPRAVRRGSPSDGRGRGARRRRRHAPSQRAAHQSARSGSIARDVVPREIGIAHGAEQREAGVYGARARPGRRRTTAAR